MTKICVYLSRRAGICGSKKTNQLRNGPGQMAPRNEEFRIMSYSAGSRQRAAGSSEARNPQIPKSPNPQIPPPCPSACCVVKQKGTVPFLLRKNRDSPRRGVLLLVVLALLAMFALVGITFVMLTSHARRGAQAAARAEQYADPADDLLGEVVLQCLRGTIRPASVLQNHSLLEDLYGADPTGRLHDGNDDDGDLVPDNPEEAHLVVVDRAPTPITPITPGGQLQEMQVTWRGGERVLQPRDFVGHVLTAVSGPASGKSTRVVNYRVDDAGTPLDPTDDLVYLHYVAFPGGIVPVVDDALVINGTPFGGTGFGYDPGAATSSPMTQPQLTATFNDPISGQTYGYALVPNPVSFLQNPAFSYIDLSGPGGANEDYDAADYQNMLLAMQLPEDISPTMPAGTTPIPSLHRPALVNYWFRRLPAMLGAGSMFAGAGPLNQQTWFTDPTAVIDGTALPPAEQQVIIALKRRILMRPLHEDHPNFTGGNATVAGTKATFFPLWDGYTNLVDFDLNLNGVLDPGEQIPCYWDVDNDGDGITDSIWVDAGLPVRPAADGRLYKPLVAILCTDLDGRLNLNAHGCLAQTQTAYYNAQSLGINIGAGAVNALNVPRGQGVGTAEVNLNALFSPTPQPAAECAALVASRYGAMTDGRPGTRDTSGSPPYDLPPADPLSANGMFNYPGWYDLSATYTPSGNGTSSYGTPMDLMGAICVGLDLRGQPLYVAGDGQFFGIGNDVGLRTENPYQMNLCGAARGTPGMPGSLCSPDAPFAPSELEALLRFFDVDAGTLPGRITTLVANRLGRLVTTESWDLPTPAVALPPELRARARVAAWLPARKGNHLADLLKARLVAEDDSLDDPDDVNDVNTLNARMAELLWPELLGGLRMDLNRMFGNGRDVAVHGNPANGVIDEPDESVNPTPDLWYPQASAAGTDVSTTVLDPDNDGTPGTRYYAAARQDYARHLYVMMLLLMNYDGTDPAVARQVAQWAINIVDFRDRDSIMTPFEYDENPFDGWNADGLVAVVNPGCGVVWGCERPELLITETLAFHDRRTEDRNDELPYPLKDDALYCDPEKNPGPRNDLDYDQRRRPQGSLFVELYNPWTDNETKPAELYDTNAVGVDMKKTSNAGNSPVWRLLIVRKDLEEVEQYLEMDPDDPDMSKRPPIERAVYFVDGTAVTLPPDGDAQYYPSSALVSRFAPIRPGRYAVIGPGDPGSTTSTTEISKRTDGDSKCRRIELDPDSDPDSGNQVRVFSKGGATDDLVGLNVQDAVAIVVNRPHRMSISEPAVAADYYDAADPEGTAYDLDNDRYPKPWDEPQDKRHQAAVWDILSRNGVHPQFARVHLQRLANPLLAYHQDTNPYRTVDSMQVDLTTFNGVDTPIPESHENQPTSEGDAFFSRERGENDETGNKTHNLWSQALQTGRQPFYLSDAAPNCNTVNRVKPANAHYYDKPEGFACTLGYLNEGFQGTPPDRWWSSADGVPNQYYGAPKGEPFPWLTWLNRPFVSPAELMLVPKWRSSQLLSYFNSPAVTTPGSYENADQPFAQLTNYYFDAHAPTDPPNWKLHRLLEFVRVPSRFVGTQLQGNPAAFTEDTDTPKHSFHPPFDRISNYRDPGRINLNTIASQRVWNGLTNFLTTGTKATWANLVKSRRANNPSLSGITKATEYLFALDPTGRYPTRFENPFRSFAGKYLLPDTDPTNTYELQDLIGNEINATLLRPAPNPSGAGFTNQPLFDYVPAAQQSVNNTNRNPAFRYQLLGRLNSMVTNRSNVYALWITVGNFEAEPWVQTGTMAGQPVNDQGLTQQEFLQIHPDGYRLGQEQGSDTGEIRRHRAFAIIDRSIPVGFQRGEDLNVEDAILLRRFIE